MMLLQQGGIVGLGEADDNLVLTSLRMTDPLLHIGNHDCAKTTWPIVAPARHALAANT